MDNDTKPQTLPTPAPTLPIAPAGIFFRVTISGQPKTDDEAMAVKRAVSKALAGFEGLRVDFAITER